MSYTCARPGHCLGDACYLDTDCYRDWTCDRGSCSSFVRNPYKGPKFVIGGITGVLILLAVVGTFLFFCMRSRNQRKLQREIDQSTAHMRAPPPYPGPPGMPPQMPATYDSLHNEYQTKGSYMGTPHSTASPLAYSSPGVASPMMPFSSPQPNYFAVPINTPIQPNEYTANQPAIELPAAPIRAVEMDTLSESKSPGPLKERTVPLKGDKSDAAINDRSK